MVSISDLDRADVLAALYNAARLQDMGFLHYNPTPMTHEEAQGILNTDSIYCYFDYLKGRVMKISLKEGDKELDTRLYNRDNGDGSAERVIEELRKTSDVNNNVVQAYHVEGKHHAAIDALSMPSGGKTDIGYRLGLTDQAKQAAINAVTNKEGD